MSEFLDNFMREVLEEISNRKPTIVKKIINSDSANYYCNIVDDIIIGEQSKINNYMFLYKYDEDNKYRRITISFNRGCSLNTDYIIPVISIGSSLTTQEVQSELFKKDSKANYETDYLSKVVITEELFEEYKYVEIRDLVIMEFIKIIEQIEEIYNNEKLEKFYLLTEEFKTKQAEKKDLLHTLLHDKKEVKVITQEDIRKKLSSVNLTQQQIEDINKIIK